MKDAPPNSTDNLLNHVRRGGRLGVFTYTKAIVVDAKTLERFERAHQWLLKAEGRGYRMRTGKTSVYLLPGQLKMLDN